MLNRVCCIALVSLATFSDAFSHSLEGMVSEDKISSFNDVDELMKKYEDLRNPKELEALRVLGEANPVVLAAALRNIFRDVNTQSPHESVFDLKLLWPKGSEIDVCFFNGKEIHRRQILKIASVIFENIPELSLSESISDCKKDDDSEVRLTFRTNGYWSYVGTSAKQIKYPYPTIGFQDLDNNQLSEIDRGTILHEFSHVIGALHEHQHPDSNCEKEFDWTSVYRNINLTEDVIDYNMRKIAMRHELSVSSYDKESVMHYHTPPIYFKDPRNSSCLHDRENTSLSEGDIKALSNLYTSK